MKRVGVDIGGTFTDLVSLDESTWDLSKNKVLTSPDPSDGLVEACNRAGIRAEEVDLFLHATTIITNLIIQRMGAKVAFITTKGFRDILDIQTSLKPNPYDLQWEKTPSLVPRYLCQEIDERIDAKGSVLIAPKEKEIREVLNGLVAEGIDSLAVCLLNSYANSAHEELVGKIARGLRPNVFVSLSCEIDPRIREYPRMSTTVANAYAMPAFHRYASGLDSKIPVRHGIKFMQSSGGVVGASEAARAPINLAYSGPVGGVLGGKLLANLVNNKNLVTFDMGGTSLDVCVIQDGEADDKDELMIQWGIPIRSHTVDIHSIGAGGGSIIAIDPGGVLTVGPRSAGADPGPASYGRGGTNPTITDANLLLRLVNSERFAAGEIPLDRTLAEEAMSPIAAHFDMSIEEAAVGAYRTVNSNMAQAIREITVFKGVDPRGFTLVAFGGGGGQHAVEVAREMGMKRVIIPMLPAVFSAVGLLNADLMQTTSKTVLSEISSLDVDWLELKLQELEAQAKHALLDEEVVREITVRRIAYSRYIGQSHELPIPLAEKMDTDSIYRDFEEAHLLRYGTRLGDPAEIVDVKIVAVGHVSRFDMRKWMGGSTKPSPRGEVSTAFGQAIVYERSDLGAGATLRGPALIEEPDTTTFVSSDTHAKVDEYGNIEIQIS